MGFAVTARVILAGVTLVAEAIQSQNYVQGSSGWIISADGDVEFNDGTFRGTLTANAITGTSIGSSTIQNSDIQGGTQEDTSIVMTDTGGGTVLEYATTQVTQTFSSSGSFVVPLGITSVKAEAWGGGGGGQSGSGAGGGGGEYAAVTALTVIPGETLTITLGAGGAGGPAGAGGPGSNGGTTHINRVGPVTLVSAHGGIGSINFTNIAGGSGSFNPIHFNGGSATIGTAGVKKGGGGGGSSGGTSATGGTGHANSGLTAGAGGTAPSGAGAGGNGGTGSTGTTPTAGSAGGAPGGGGGTGGSGSNVNAAGGAGAHGQVRITYNSAQTLVGSFAPSAGTDSMGNPYRATNNESPITYTPVVTGGGTAAFSVKSGWYMRFGKLVFFALQLSVSVAGSGASLITVTTPTAIERTLRQQFICESESTTAAFSGVNVAIAFTSGTTNTIDRIRSATGANMTGADLLAGAAVTISGTYREA